MKKYVRINVFIPNEVNETSMDYPVVVEENEFDKVWNLIYNYVPSHREKFRTAFDYNGSCSIREGRRHIEIDVREV